MTKQDFLKLVEAEFMNQTDGCKYSAPWCWKMGPNAPKKLGAKLWNKLKSNLKQ